MFRAAVWTLRQRRYAALAAMMAVLALACAAAGTFELHRFQEKRHDNGVLRANAHAPAAPLSTALVPFAGHAGGPSAQAIRFRTVTASGRYVLGQEHYVTDQSQGGRQGFYVLTPLRTDAGTLLVVRGFVAATADETRPATVAAPPAGVVRISGRLETAQTGNDQLGRLGRNEVTSINPTEQAARLGDPTYDAYVTLNAHAPGTAGLRPVPAPDLSNPTGGAGELQLFSYIVQWYVFALLALVAPFLFSRAEVRDAQRRFLGIDPDAGELGLEAGAATAPAALEAPVPAGAESGELAVRRAGELVARDVDPRRRARAARLADRYGRSLGMQHDLAGDADATPEARPPYVRTGGLPDLDPATSSRPAATGPHRSNDAYHGSYNDYLWQLALADGATPEVPLPSGERCDRAARDSSGSPPAVVELPDADDGR